MEINAVVSENARRLREEKRLTLDEAAEVIRQHNITLLPADLRT